MDQDLRIRLAAFQWLAEQVDIHGDVLPRKLLHEGFVFNGEKVPLISPQGIFKPHIMDLPLTITTSPNSPYDDNFSSSGYLHYRYRGTDPNHRDNRILRKAFEDKRPLIYLHGIVPGRYLVVWPVYIVGDNPDALTFEVALDDLASIDVDAEPLTTIAEGTEARRVYLTMTVRQRMHQQSFRERVIEAYRSQCAFCRLRHRELLDAAHIIPDAAEEGRPVVTNGMALCKLHHAAFDSFILGVTPDYLIKVREDIMLEEDGPILRHGLQGLEGLKIQLPSDSSQWPSQDALAWKFEKFQRAA